MSETDGPRTETGDTTQQQQTTSETVVARLRGIRRLLKPILTAEVIAAVEIALVLPASLEYCRSADERTRERHYQAWQVLALADGKGGDGGRIDALEDLNRDRVSLRGVRVSQAYLDSVDLAGADMKAARLERASMVGGNLVGAFAARSEMVGTDLYGSRSHDADFAFARADSARFFGSTLCRTLFFGASLRGATFERARLDSADFRGADLRGARFSLDTLPPGIRFERANVAGVSPDPFRIAAVAGGAVEVPDSAGWAARTVAMDGLLKTLWFHADTARMERIRRVPPERRRCLPSEELSVR